MADTPYDQSDPSWSSDGKKLAFGRFGEIEAGGIHLVDLATRLASDIPGSQKLFSGRWSPDGRYMAALTTDSTKLALFNFKTQTWFDCVTEAGAVGFPNWSADSQYLYYDINIEPWDWMMVASSALVIVALALPDTFFVYLMWRT